MAKINFNDLRKKTCIAYDNLAIKLNDATEDGTVTIDAYDISKEMTELRDLIMLIAMSYSEKDNEIKDVFSEIYPGEKNMVFFNN